MPAPAKKAIPKPEPAKSCGHCDKPMPAMRSAGAKFCSDACKRAERRRLERLQPYYPDA
jgi:hypothetical protein